MDIKMPSPRSFSGATFFTGLQLIFVVVLRRDAACARAAEESQHHTGGNQKIISAYGSVLEVPDANARERRNQRSALRAEGDGELEEGRRVEDDYVQEKDCTQQTTSSAIFTADARRATYTTEGKDTAEGGEDKTASRLPRKVDATDQVRQEKLEEEENAENDEEEYAKDNVTQRARSFTAEDEQGFTVTSSRVNVRSPWTPDPVEISTSDYIENVWVSSTSHSQIAVNRRRCSGADLEVDDLVVGGGGEMLYDYNDFSVATCEGPRKELTFWQANVPKVGGDDKHPTVQIVFNVLMQMRHKNIWIPPEISCWASDGDRGAGMHSNGRATAKILASRILNSMITSFGT
ncbi:unnamed protein product [Amoebophrya sp. A25]|nr:unnamed protein product [Amoebophrya sp. A25]|eukprot:GSA25T00024684001.1